MGCARDGRTIFELEDSYIFQDSSAFHLCMPILKTEDPQCSTKSQTATILPSPQGLPCRDGTRCASEALPHVPPSKTTTVLGKHISQVPASSTWTDLCPAALNEVLEIHRLYCEKMPTVFPREIQVWMQMAVSSLHPQPSQLLAGMAE